MFKFLRKYNKMLLAIFGVLLMITFLIPQAFSRFSQAAGARSGTVATVGDGEKISALEWDRYQRELRVLERLNNGRAPTFPGLGEIKSPEHWFLLVREAQQAGVVPVLDMREVTNEQMMNLMAAADERDPNIITRAQAHYGGVAQLINLYSTGDLYSDRRLRSEAERLLHMVSARMVVVQPDAEKSDLQLTEQQIKEHMDKYADKLPGTGEFGFGYKLPNRVKIEWMTVSADSVRKVVENSPEMDGVQQRLHWKRNSTKFPQNPYPSDGSAAAIPDVVKNDLVNQLTKTKLEDISKFASDTLRMALRSLPEKEGYLVLPEEWATRQKPLPQLAEELRSRFGIDLPAYTARGDTWLKPEDIPQLPGIGTATSDKVGNTPVSLADLVNATHELGGSSTIIVQKGVAGPPVKDAQGNLYLFRVTDADASRVPNSVDEVRDQVVKDLKRQADYQRIKGSLAELESKARSSGLLQTALENSTVVQAPAGVYLWSEYWIQMMAQYRMPLTPQPATLPVIGDDRKVAEAIIDRAMALPQDKPADQLTPEQRIFAVASDDKLAVLLVEVTAQQPLTRQSFDRLASMGAIQQLVSREETKDENTVEKAFAYDVLAKRNGFAMKRAEEEQTDGKTAPAEPTKTAAVN